MAATSRLSFCSHISPRTSFEEDVALAAKYGFAGLSVGEAKLDDAASDDERRRVLEDAGLRATACIPYGFSALPIAGAPPTFLGSEDTDELLQGMCTSVARLAKFNPPSIVLQTGGAREGRNPADERAIAVEGLREAARVAAREGTRISVEGIRFDAWSLVRTLPDLIDLIEEVGESNVDLVFDVWNQWDTPDVIAMAERYAKQIGVVHVNDWLEDPPLPASGFAGDGVADIPAMFAALERGGFTGWYAVEVFQPEFETIDPEDIFRRGRESWDRTWAAVHALV
jgi:sugar phosphate isomerase/epimerase